MPDFADEGGDAPPVPRRVLCIDDDEDVLHVMKLSLEVLLRTRVTCVSNGHAAVARALDVEPDLILLDIVMPGIGGQAILEAIRAETALARIPVVVTSGRASSHEAEDYRALGATDVIAKPFSAGGLADDVARIWKRHVARSAAAAEAKRREQRAGSAAEHGAAATSSTPP